MSDPLLTSLCGICHISVPKYKCPRCGARTCSLGCIKKHKAWSECSGERDATAYVAPSKLRTPAGVDHDYNFLHGIELSVERAEKLLVEERGIVQEEELRPMTIQEVKWKPGRDGRKRKVLVTRVLREAKGRSFERHLTARLKKLNITIMCVPTGMVRQRANNTTLNRRTMRVNWQVEWMTFEDNTDTESKKIRALSKVMDDMPLYQAYHTFLEEEQRVKGKQSKKIPRGQLFLRLSMAERVAKIRPYKGDDADEKLVRFTVGKASMEGLASANAKTYVHPIFLAVWTALAAALIQWLNWWPNTALPWWTYLKPIPAFAAFLVPLMFIVDLRNRPPFEEALNEVLRRPDMVDLQAYYSRSPSSGLYILEYGDKFVGMLALDASMDATSNKTFNSNDSPAQANAIKKQFSKKGTSEIATVRHFYIMEEYRAALVQEDLLHYAVSQAFGNDPKLRIIRGIDSDLERWKVRAFTKEGFAVEKELKRIGLLGWRFRSRELTRERWEELQKKLT